MLDCFLVHGSNKSEIKKKKTTQLPTPNHSHVAAKQSILKEKRYFGLKKLFKKMLPVTDGLDEFRSLRSEDTKRYKNRDEPLKNSH